MRSQIGLMTLLVVLAASAAVVAFTLGLVAHNDVGLTGVEIRHSALIASAVIAMLIVV
jgi:hypothetical protein